MNINTSLHRSKVLTLYVKNHRHNASKGSVSRCSQNLDDHLGYQGIAGAIKQSSTHRRNRVDFSFIYSVYCSMSKHHTNAQIHVKRQAMSRTARSEL